MTKDRLVLAENSYLSDVRLWVKYAWKPVITTKSAMATAVANLYSDRLCIVVASFKDHSPIDCQ